MVSLTKEISNKTSLTLIMKSLVETMLLTDPTFMIQLSERKGKYYLYYNIVPIKKLKCDTILELNLMQFLLPVW